MAETINGVPIGDLPGIESVPDDSMLVVEFLGKAYHMPGAVLRQMIQDVLDSMGDSVDDVTEARLTAAIETVLASGKYNGVSPSVEVLDEEDGTSVIHVIDAFGDKRYPVAVKGATDAVRYKPQTLTDAQKAQARANIGALSAADISDKDNEVVIVKISGSFDAGYTVLLGDFPAPAGGLNALVENGSIVIGIADGDLTFPLAGFDDYTVPSGTVFSYSPHDFSNNGTFWVNHVRDFQGMPDNKSCVLKSQSDGSVWTASVITEQYTFYLTGDYPGRILQYDGVQLLADRAFEILQDAVNNDAPIFCFQKDAAFDVEDSSTYTPPIGTPFYYNSEAGAFRCERDGFDCTLTVGMFGYTATAEKTTPYKTAESKADDLKAEDGTLFLLSAGEPIGEGVTLPTGSADDSKIFIADLNTSTYEDIKAANDAGKICYALWGGYTACMLTTLSGDSAIFTTLLDPHLGLYVKFTAGTTGVSDFGLTESHSILYDTQSLTDAQKAQARENIGALSADDIDVDSIGSNVFVGKYDTVTFTEIKTAHDAGRVCFLDFKGIPFLLLGVDDTEALFVREMNENQDYEVTITADGGKSFKILDKNISDVYVAGLFSAKYAEAKAAYEAGKACFVTYGALLCPLTVLDDEKAEFVGMLTPHIGMKGILYADGTYNFTYVHSNAVQTVAQSLTDDQKIQARTNIGAVSKSEAVEAVKIGGTNLIRKSDVETSSTGYLIGIYSPVYPLVAGDEYTVSVCVTPAEDVTELRLYMSSGSICPCKLNVSGTGKQVLSKTFTAVYSDGKTPEDSAAHADIRFYRWPNVSGNTTAIHWVKIEKGNKATDWSPSPTDVQRTVVSMIPYGTAIARNSDLNTTDFLKVGNYYCSTNVATQTLANCPTVYGFMMQVYSPLSETIDNETTTPGVYRVRKLMDFHGNEYVQKVYSGSTANVWVYGTWDKVIKSPDLQEYLKSSAQTLTEEQKAQVRTNIGALSTDDVDTVLQQAKDSGLFDGEDGQDGKDGYTPVKGKDYFDGANGKTAYAYAQDGGYTGTEAEFAAKLASDSEPLVVTLSGNDTDGYTADKTVAEIYAARNAGRDVYMVGGVVTYQLSYLSSSFAAFSYTMASRNAIEIISVIMMSGVAPTRIHQTIDDSYVKYTAQSLDEEYKLQARSNIGAVGYTAPANVAGTEQVTAKFHTSNGGSIAFGKEGPNSGTMIRLDQADGTCRLRFRASATAGAMVWEQPEQGAQLYVDLGKEGVDKRRITFPSSAGTLALTSQIPSLSGYLPLSGGLMTGSLKFQAASLPGKSLQYICGIDAFANGGEMGWQSKADFLSGYLTTTGTAARATADANGNNIASTYANKNAGNTFNGEQRMVNSTYAPNMNDIASGVGCSLKNARACDNQLIVAEIFAPTTAATDSTINMNAVVGEIGFYHGGSGSGGQFSGKTQLARITSAGIYEGSTLLANKYVGKSSSGGVYVSGRYAGGGDDEGIVIGRASNNYAGLTLGDRTGIRSVFYLLPDNSAVWRYNNGSVSYDIKHPGKAGTIALLSDVVEAANGALKVTLSGNDTDGYAVDKTYAEIKTAWDAGRYVYVTNGAVVCNPSLVNANLGFVFTYTRATGDGVEVWSVLVNNLGTKPTVVKKTITA